MRRFGIGYQAALEAVFAILIGILGGYYVDRWLGSAPVGLLVGLLIGFGSFVLRLVRLAGQLERLEAEAGERERAGSGGPDAGAGGAQPPGVRGAGSRGAGSGASEEAERGDG